MKKDVMCMRSTIACRSFGGEVYKMMTCNRDKNSMEFLNRGELEFLNRGNLEFLNRGNLEFLNRDKNWSF